MKLQEYFSKPGRRIPEDVILRVRMTRGPEEAEKLRGMNRALDMLDESIRTREFYFRLLCLVAILTAVALTCARAP